MGTHTTNATQPKARAAKAAAPRTLRKSAKPMPVATAVSKDTDFAVLRAMRVAVPQGEFAAKSSRKGPPTTGWQFEDRSGTYQSSFLRAKRPISRKFAERITALYDELCKSDSFSMEKEFNDNVALISELRQTYEVAKKEIPQKLKDYWDTINKGKRNDGGVRGEVTTCVAPVGVDVDDPSIIFESPFPFVKQSFMKDLDAMSKTVYGASLSTILAPALFLFQHHGDGAAKIRQLLALDEPDRAKYLTKLETNDEMKDGPGLLADLYCKSNSDKGNDSDKSAAKDAKDKSSSDAKHTSSGNANETKDANHTSTGNTNETKGKSVDEAQLKKCITDDAGDTPPPLSQRVGGGDDVGNAWRVLQQAGFQICPPQQNQQFQLGPPYHPMNGQFHAQNHVQNQQHYHQQQVPQHPPQPYGGFPATQPPSWYQQNPSFYNGLNGKPPPGSW